MKERSLDHSTGKHADKLALALLENEQTPLEQRISIVRALVSELFRFEPNYKWEAQRIVLFLSAAVEIFNNTNEKQAPRELKSALWGLITPAILDRLADESSVEHWDFHAVEACLEAYVTFQDIERAYGKEEARFITQNIARVAVQSRALDEQNEIIARSGADDGLIIWLGSSGAEIEGAVDKGYRDELFALQIRREVRAGYYRNNAAVVNFGNLSEDPDGNRMTPAQVMAQLARREMADIVGPVQLPVPQKVNKLGEPAIIWAMPQVGGAIAPTGGYAQSLNYQAAQRAGLDFASASAGVVDYRNWPFFPREAVPIIYSGDGAEPMNTAAQSYLVGVPLINVIEDNGVAIGARSQDIYPGQLEHIGHAVGTPGIRIQKGDFGKAYLASRFAVRRGIMGGDSTVICLETSRLVPHSNAHGQYEAGVPIRKLLSTAQKVSVSPELIKAIGNAGVKTSLLDIRKQLQKILVEFFDINETLKQEITAYINTIIDPNERLFEWVKQGFFTKDELATWYHQAQHEFEAVRNEVLKLPYVSVEHVGVKPISFPHRRQDKLLGEENKDQAVKMGASQALAYVLDHALHHPGLNLLIRGVDADKGFKPMPNKSTKQVEVVRTGGYWEQTSLSKDPLRVGALRSDKIDEYMTSAWNAGLALASTAQLEESFQVCADYQYIDYFINALGLWEYMGKTPMTSGGHYTFREVAVATTGASAGAGPGHAHEYSGYMWDLPESVHVYYPSTPTHVYRMARWAFEGGLDHPAVFLWPRAIAFMSEEFNLVLTPETMPGNACTRVNNDPAKNKYQIVSFGVSMVKIRSELARREKQGENWEGLNWFDPISLRPFDWEGLYQYLDLGVKNKTPITFFQEDFAGKGAGNRIRDTILDWDFFKPVVRGRQVKVVGSMPLDAQPASGNLQKAILPDISYFFDLLSARNMSGLNEFYQRQYKYYK